MFILDTNVVSELRKGGAGNVNVAAWARGINPSVLFVSAITVLELEIGVLQVQRRDVPQGARLRAWLDDQVLRDFADRILPVDVAVAQCCARLHVPDRRGERDALIAATALVHGMSVVTRNVTDFAPTGALLLNPWGQARSPRRQ